MVHLTLALTNDKPTLCGIHPGGGLTQLIAGFRIQPAVDCRECLNIYESAKPAFDAMLRLPPTLEEWEAAERKGE